MKTLQNYITEKILISKNSKIGYIYHPKTKDELRKIIKQKIESEGNECDLNDIDTSNITDMSNLFADSDFNGNISKWDVSNVKNMRGTFYCSKFNGDISNWDVSNVKDMKYMFEFSIFNNDISNWDVYNVTFKLDMFQNYPIKEKYKPKFKI